VAGEVSLVEGQAEDVCSAVHEALENVVRHAHASRVTVFGERAEDQVCIGPG
jgi:signal transduction histidine kinase